MLARTPGLDAQLSATAPSLVRWLAAEHAGASCRDTPHHRPNFSFEASRCLGLSVTVDSIATWWK